MKPRFNVQWLLSALGVAAVMLFMYWADRNLDPYKARLLNLWAINAIFAVTFNLIYGYTGQFSLAHAGLAGVGAYTMALLTMSPVTKANMYLLEPPMWPISVVRWPFLPSLLASGLVAALFGLIAGGPSLRLRGDYLVMATFGFSEIVRIVISGLPSITNGALGLKNIPKIANNAWAWGMVILTVFVTKRLKESSYGRALRAIGGDEIAAEAAGVNLFSHKLLAFVVSAFFTGIGGALLANLLTALEPKLFSSALTTGVITTVVLGGIGSLTGNIIGSGIYTLLFELLRTLDQPWKLAGYTIPGRYGTRVFAISLVLLLMMLYYRRGLMGRNEFTWDAVFARIRSVLTRGSASSAETAEQGEA